MMESTYGSEQTMQIGATLYKWLKLDPNLLARQPAEMEKFNEVLEWAIEHPESLNDFRTVLLNKTNPDINNLDVLYEFVLVLDKHEDLMEEMDMVNKQLDAFLK